MMDIAVAPPDEDGIVLVTLGGDDDQPWGTPQEECAVLAPYQAPPHGVSAADPSFHTV